MIANTRHNVYSFQVLFLVPCVGLAKALGAETIVSIL